MSVRAAGASQWRIVKENKSGFLTVRLVERGVDEAKQTGYFKYASAGMQRKYIGPLVANELLGNRLGHLLDLPMAVTELADIGGHLGVVSVRHKAPKLYKWCDLQEDVRIAIEEKMVDSERLFKTFVFDAWICNIDRSGKNIIVYEEVDGVHNFYLIDHELSLLGALRFEGKAWDSHYWEDIRRYTRGYHPALLDYIVDIDRLKPYIEEIQSLSSGVIRDVIDSCPSLVLERADRDTMEKFLLRRQRKLRRIIERCIRAT